MILPVIPFFLILVILPAAAKPLQFDDPNPQRYQLTARASKIDPRVKAHPKINFLINSKSGKPADIQDASVDTRVTPRGKLVIWLMGNNKDLFRILNEQGLHTLRVHYANKWFSMCCQERPVSEHCRGNIRLEAATGEDHSDEVSIPKPDSIKERAFQFVKYLAKRNPQGKWSYFLNQDQTDLRWDNVILSGSSHGSTTASRLAKHTQVSRVVAFCGPRDQHQTWQKLPSATPQNRYFGFSHVLDMGWKADHYCRSWELLGMHQFGPIVNIEQSKPPYQNTRRLITDYDVGKDAKKAHSGVLPKKYSPKTKNGDYTHQTVWKYLFTHPVDEVGKAQPLDDSCLKNHLQ
ncbi:MAG: BPSS1187 family protein [Akkermansiaceae bacterium]